MKTSLAVVCGIFLTVLAVDFFGKNRGAQSVRAEQAAAAARQENAEPAKKIYVAGVPNAAQVDEHLYRGAQPRTPGLRELKNLGIATVVDLRDEEKSKIAWEQRTADSLGMRFVNIPVNGWAPPSDQQVAMFLEIFRENPQEKVFVHCHFGDDRTGVFVATYRIAFDKFSTRQALQEMNQFGFNQSWHRNMSGYVREFQEHLESSPALAAFK